MPRIAIIENSEFLGGYFADHLGGIDCEIFPVWKSPDFPPDDYDAYILTGDYNNISDGLLPFHQMEIDYVRSIRGKRIFASCFAHQLLAHAFGGSVGMRTKRHFGWHPVIISEPHPIFEGLDKPCFLSLNGDEVVHKPTEAKLLAVDPDCTYQILLYGDTILTCQAHPEILKADALAGIERHRERLSVRCPDMDGLLEKTLPLADDDASRRFMANVVKWLTGD